MNSIEWVIQDHKRMIHDELSSVPRHATHKNEQAVKEYDEIIRILNAAKSYIDVVDNSSSEVSVPLNEEECYQELRKLVKSWWGDFL